MSAGARGADGPVPRSAAVSFGLAAVALAMCIAFASLGAWQIARRAWKLDLIERVEQRVHAPVVDAPASSAWREMLTARNDHEYRHVLVRGTYLHERETLVQASTDLGPGFWVVTPLRAADGSVVLVNRGFVPPEHRERATRRAGEPQGDVPVTGLLRWTEPRGQLLRRNDAAAARWYSRDVQAIAAARGLKDTAPYFIDADAVGDTATTAPLAGDTQPVGGLTVIAFPNNHTVYALTWFALAAMAGAAAVQVLRTARSMARE